MTRTIKTLTAALVISVTSALTPASAQDWPTKAVKLIVPFPPGGGTDIIARVLGNHLATSLKQPFVVENKPGAGGNIGIDLAAKSPADGYTIVLGQTSNLAINPTLYAKLPYDPVKDLTPVALVADAPLVFVVSADSKLKTLADVLSAAKLKPGEVTFGSPGNGTVAHLTGELMQRAADAKLLHIPYKGSAPALTDLLGGRIDTFMASVPTALSQIKGGKLRALAVSSANRSPSLPDVPTMAEAGLKGFDSTTWFGIMVPAGTPKPIVDKLNSAINAALKAPEVGEKIAAEGGAPLGGTADKFATVLKADLASWGKVVKASGAKID
jgi:tripartite-type tricarboxylate transporter receptor subunit TctC